MKCHFKIDNSNVYSTLIIHLTLMVHIFKIYYLNLKNKIIDVFINHLDITYIKFQINSYFTCALTKWLRTHLIKFFKICMVEGDVSLKIDIYIQIIFKLDDYLNEEKIHQ